jgi:hypothetical protein
MMWRCEGGGGGGGCPGWGGAPPRAPPPPPFTHRLSARGVAGKVTAVDAATLASGAREAAVAVPVLRWCGEGRGEWGARVLLGLIATEEGLDASGKRRVYAAGDGRSDATRNAAAWRVAALAVAMAMGQRHDALRGRAGRWCGDTPLPQCRRAGGRAGGSADGARHHVGGQGVGGAGGRGTLSTRMRLAPPPPLLRSTVVQVGSRVRARCRSIVWAPRADVG